MHQGNTTGREREKEKKIPEIIFSCLPASSKTQPSTRPTRSTLKPHTDFSILTTGKKKWSYLYHAKGNLKWEAVV